MTKHEPFGVTTPTSPRWRETSKEDWEQVFSARLPADVASRYGTVFRGQAITFQNMGSVTEKHLMEMGVLIGHRRAVLDSIEDQSRALGEEARGERKLSESAAIPPPDWTSLLDPSVALVNDNGLCWVSLKGVRPTFDDFFAEIHNAIKLYNFPKAFERCFLDNKQMPNLLHEYHDRAFCIAIVLRIPEEPDNLDEGNTLATITNRFVVLARLEGSRSGIILTYHKNDLAAIQDLRNSWSTAAYPPLAIDHLLEVLRRAIRQFGPALDVLRNRAEFWEDNQKDFVRSVEKLSELQKQAGVYKRCLSAISTSVFDVLESDDVKGEVLLDIKDLKERTLVFTSVAEELAENSYNTVNLMMALDGFRGGQNLKFFTYLSFVLQPVSIMTGWYGMNFDNMPDLHYEHSYWVFIAVAVSVVLLVMLGLFFKG